MWPFRKENADLSSLKSDMHSHLIPGIDDGSQGIYESLELIRKFADLGYKKLITTPHIMNDFYPNSSDNIIPLLEDLRKRIREEEIEMELEAAAEYYLDEFLLEKLDKKEPLLMFGKNMVLFGYS